MLVYIGGNDDYGPGEIRLNVLEPAVDAESLTEVRTRLADLGWRVGNVSSDRYEKWFLAATDDVIAAWRIVNRVNDFDVVEGSFEPNLRVSIARQQPLDVLPAMSLGGLVGLLVAAIALLLGRLLGRGCPQRWRRIAGGLCWTGLAALCPAGTWAVAGLVYTMLMSGSLEVPVAPWDAYMFILVRPIALFGLMCFLCSSAVLVIGRTMTRPPVDVA